MSKKAKKSKKSDKTDVTVRKGVVIWDDAHHAPDTWNSFPKEYEAVRCITAGFIVEQPKGVTVIQTMGVPFDPDEDVGHWFMIPKGCIIRIVYDEEDE